MNLQKGFTLIELMIVVAIIGILAAVALPAYNDYIERSKVSTAAANVQTVKNGVTDCWMQDGSFVNCNGGNATYRIIDDFAATDGALMAGADTLATAAGVVSITTVGRDRANAQMTLTFTPTATLNQTVLLWDMTGTGCEDGGNPRGIKCGASD